MQGDLTAQIFLQRDLTRLLCSGHPDEIIVIDIINVVIVSHLTGETQVIGRNPCRISRII